VKLGKNNQQLGTAELEIVVCRIERTHLLEWYQMNFDAINSAVTIIVCAAEVIQIGNWRKLPTFPHGKPGGSRQSV
jgi:hypothetical protein